MSLLSRASALSLATVLWVAVLAPGQAARPPKRAAVATSYVVGQQQDDGSIPGFSPLGTTADAVLALVAARRAPESISSALDYLEEHAADATTIGEIAKLALAAVAGGRDVHDFGGRDLTSEIVSSERPDGRYGEDTAVLHQALAVLALIGAGEEPSARALEWLVDAQCPDGGWQFDEPYSSGDNRHCFTGDATTDPFKSDTNTTSLATQAIDASGVTGFRYRGDPIAFFKKIRDDVKGGWGYTWGFRLTDSNSTALAIQAFVAAGRPLPSGSMRALQKLQYRLCGDDAGAFAFTWEKTDSGRYRKTGPDVGATVGAIPGLLKDPLPIERAEVTRQAPAPGPC